MNRLYKNLVKLQKELPWVNSILRFIDIIETDKIPIAAVGLNKNKSRYNLYINLEAIEKDSDILGVLEHEVLHVLYSHLETSWADENRELANIAMDLVINETGIFTQKVTLDKIDKKTIKKHYDIDFCSYNDTSVEVFKKLLESQENPNKNDSGNGPSNFDSTDLKDLTPIKDSDIIDDKTLESIADSIDRNYGNVSSDIKRSLEIKEKNFKNLFKKLVGSSLRQDYKRTFKKVGKRYPNQKGRVKLKKPSILLVIDTSGSMSDESLENINYQVNTLSKKFDLTVCWGDTELKGESKIKKLQKFTNELVGGGGTDLQFYKDIKGKFDLYIFDTDGYIPEYQWPKKSIFCIYDDGQKVEGYTNLFF